MDSSISFICAVGDIGKKMPPFTIACHLNNPLPFRRRGENKKEFSSSTVLHPLPFKPGPFVCTEEKMGKNAPLYSTESLVIRSSPFCSCRGEDGNKFPPPQCCIIPCSKQPLSILQWRRWAKLPQPQYCIAHHLIQPLSLVWIRRWEIIIPIHSPVSFAI